MYMTINEALVKFDHSALHKAERDGKLGEIPYFKEIHSIHKPIADDKEKGYYLDTRVNYVEKAIKLKLSKEEKNGLKTFVYYSGGLLSTEKKTQ